MADNNWKSIATERGTNPL